ncbi:PQQ-dependent sugar dehydrogenase [uncultured Algimonas sp.]|uniref:PQQ-dependent sugar dehydrogenase n=1 Tax=uncultured Algimonas sp. TaxID=1547920 RepID=UPI00262D3215|nr:PQQ-dependent sugar dehydrogenase [uncultured Algimonas sp.]
MKQWVPGLSCLALIGLAACLEAQPAPDRPERPLSDFRIETVADSLPAPWAAAALPQGGYLVTGKLGRLWIVRDGNRQEITGLPREIIALANNRIATDGQGGLLDVALAPDFAQTGTIYLSYSYGDWDANGTALLRATLDGDRLRDPVTIFRAGPAKEAGSHYGGKIAFPGDGTLLLSLGDGFSLREEAQKTDSHLGSVVRLMPDGGTPTDNPDFGDGAKLQLFSIGHRNVQGLAIDPDTGAIWQHEHGPRGGDELNRLEAGANHGWPIATHGRDYQGARISPTEDHAGFTAPVHVWTPSIAPSGLAIYRGDLFPDWQGHALVGGLASGDLRRVDPISGEETILLSDAKTDDDPFRVRDVDVEADGSVLVLVEDAKTGHLLRLRPR